MTPEPPDRAAITLRTSTASANGGSCVQVGQHNGTFYLADSTDPRGPLLPVAPGDYQAFMNALKATPCL